MCNDFVIRRFAGVFVLLSVAAGYWLSPWWFLFTAFVGLNLFQSAFSNWCPMIAFLKKLGVQSTEHGAGAKARA